MREGADQDLLRALKSTKESQESLMALEHAVEPFLNMIPAPAGVEESLIEWAKAAPGRLAQYIKDMSISVVQGLMATLRLHLPSFDLSALMTLPEDKGDEDLAAMQEEVKAAAEEYSQILDLVE